MVDTKPKSCLDFAPISLETKPTYDGFRLNETDRGCESDFVNVYLWGEQSVALYDGHLIVLARFGNRFAYHYPFGEGNPEKTLRAIQMDAEYRRIPLRLIGLTEKAVETVESLFPSAFSFEENRDSFDYVYDINDLADLVGKRYNGKRNHLNRFRENYPSAKLIPLTEEYIPAVKKMAEQWFREREENDAETDFSSEKSALDRALSEFRPLSLDGMILTNQTELLAFTIGSRMTSDTFDVHFEKARSDVQGAYAAINQGFASYIRSRYPDVRFLDREEDMGIEGLRRAKESYRPHHFIKKWTALYKGETK